MNIIDTFYILFKSNSEDVIKGNRAVEKSTKETESALKNTNEQAENLGKSFVKIMEGAAGVAGVWAATGYFKNGVKEAIDYNSQLEITAKLYGAQAQSLKGLAAAAAQYGGTKQGALDDMASILGAAQHMGISKVSLPAILAEAHNRVKNIPNAANKMNMLRAYGFNDPGLLMALSGNDADFHKYMTAAHMTPLTDKQSAEALAAKQAFNKLDTAKDNFFNTLSSTLMPALINLTNKVTELVNYLAKSSGLSLGAAAGGTAVTAYGANKIIKGASKIIKGASKLLSGGSGGAATEAAAGTTTAAEAAAVGASTVALPLTLAVLEVGYAGYQMSSKEFWQRDLRELKMLFGSSSTKPKAPLTSNMSDRMKQGMAFFMSKGYSKDQAAAIMANLQGESSLDINSTGDNGLAHGLAQWHPDRAANILKNTGIDINNSTYEQQLQAVYWEMQNGRPQFNDAKFRQMSGMGASSYFTSQYETPRDIVGQSIARGQNALALASNFNGFDGSTGKSVGNVTIGEINVHTQATDATGIAQNLKDELYSQMAMMGANFDDGRAK